MLTYQHINLLKLPFPAPEHEFLKGLVYLTERAITDRLDMVDPTWSFEIVRMENRNSINDEWQVIVHGRLIVGGVVRENTGMDKVSFSKKAQDRNDWQETGESEKAAVTDALKRCARLFGIGRYLLDTPDNVKEQKALADWLKPKSFEMFVTAMRSLNYTDNDKIKARLDALNLADPAIPYDVKFHAVMTMDALEKTLKKVA